MPVVKFQKSPKSSRPRVGYWKKYRDPKKANALKLPFCDKICGILHVCFSCSCQDFHVTAGTATASSKTEVFHCTFTCSRSDYKDITPPLQLPVISTTTVLQDGEGPHSFMFELVVQARSSYCSAFLCLGESVLRLLAI